MTALFYMMVDTNILMGIYFEQKAQDIVCRCVCSWALPAKEPRVIKDHEIEAFFEKETPFRQKADPRAFLVIPKLNSPHTDNTSCLDQLKASGASHLSAAGTYRLLQTVNKHDIFLRPARKPVNVSTPIDVCVQCLINNTSFCPLATGRRPSQASTRS